MEGAFVRWAMGVAERSREHVEAKLEELESTYGSFAVKQTTITLPGEQYTSMRERGNPDPIAAYIAVRNDDEEVLHVDSDSDAELPGVQVASGDSLEPAVRETVREETGVDCVVDGVEHVTIAGLRHGDDPDAETLYHLVVVFGGEHRDGTVGEEASWRRLDDGLQPAYA
jgi:ADP-ribose pyrophosphatase YjhB (NUDIX family)